MPINSRIDPRLMNDGAAGNQWEPPMTTGPISYPSPWTPPSPMPPQGRPPMPPQSNRPPWAGSPGGRFGEMPRPDGPPGSPFQPSPLQTGGLDPMPRPIPGPMPPSPMPTNPDWYYPTGGAGEEFRPTGGGMSMPVPPPTPTIQPSPYQPSPTGGAGEEFRPTGGHFDNQVPVGGFPTQTSPHRQAPMPRPEEIGQALQQHYGSKGGNASPPPAQFSGQSPTAGGKGGQQAPPSGGKGGNQGSQDYTPLRSRNGYRGG